MPPQFPPKMAFPTRVSSPKRRTASFSKLLGRPELPLAGALALAFGIAATFATAGGEGRAGEIALVGAAVVLGCLGGSELAIATGAASAAVVLALEALYGRFDGLGAWPPIAYAAAIAGAVVLSGLARPARERARPSAPRRADPLAERLRPGSLEYELRRSLRHDHFVSLVLIRPHVAGRTRRADAQLQGLAAAIGAQIRATDLAVRRGSHDFWLVLPETPDRAARVVGERLRLELGTRELALAIGIASFPNDGLSAAELVSAADKALARSIELGGNRTVLFSVPRNAPPGWGLARAS